MLPTEITQNYTIPFVILCARTKNKSKLDFQSLPGNKPEMLTSYLSLVFKTHSLSNKFVGFCGDNCNIEFGGVKLKGANNVYISLRKGIRRNIVGVGCGAHIVQNCLQTVTVLPVRIKALVVKIYKYVHIYTMRVTWLKWFCRMATSVFFLCFRLLRGSIKFVMD
jgi:hypothetical protein